MGSVTVEPWTFICYAFLYEPLLLPFVDDLVYADRTEPDNIPEPQARGLV